MLPVHRELDHVEAEMRREEHCCRKLLPLYEVRGLVRDVLVPDGQRLTERYSGREDGGRRSLVANFAGDCRRGEKVHPIDCDGTPTLRWARGGDDKVDKGHVDPPEGEEGPREKLLAVERKLN
eukprot:752615-Hanusia_phi.AAC.1